MIKQAGEQLSALSALSALSVTGSPPWYCRYALTSGMAEYTRSNLRQAVSNRMARWRTRRCDSRLADPTGVLALCGP